MLNASSSPSSGQHRGPTGSYTGRPPGRSRLFVALLVLVLALPSLASFATLLDLGTMAFHTYNGVRHLLDVKDIFMGEKGHLTAALLDVNNLHRAQDDLIAARNELQQVSDMTRQNIVLSDVGSVFPQQIMTIRALTKIGVDAADMGQELVKQAEGIVPQLSPVMLTDPKKPLITPEILALARPTIEYLLPRLSDIQVQSRSLSLDVIPFINVSLRAQVRSAVQALPLIQTNLKQAHDMMDAIGWLLGVGQPRTLLLQTLDRAELRPSGGFTGQYAEVHINGARLGPVQLHDIGPQEEGNAGAASNGQIAPDPYTWWPIPNWGLRDSNLSADFPTTAQLAIGRYQFEFHTQIDGAVSFSTFFIEDILRVLGPLFIPKYNETVTAQNLEGRLHYYQLDNGAIRKQEIVEGEPDKNLARKYFTRRVSEALLERMHHLSLEEVPGLVQTMLHSLQAKDLQIYVANPAIEHLLASYDAANQIDLSTGHDGLYVVQTNINANKGSLFIRTLLHDTVSLDNSGGATHVMQMRLVYSQIGPVWGPDAYRDYVRIYVPPTSQFRWGDGFEQVGDPLCGGHYRACPFYDIYGDGSLLCPAGLSNLGLETPLIGDPYQGDFHPLNRIGPPTNMTSDQEGRAMFGGWITVPKNCTATATLSWYVPAQVNHAYSLLVQRQPNTFPELDLTIQPPPGVCAGLHYDGIMSGEDLSFPFHSDKSTRNACATAPPM